jgi:cytochrome c-type biogenesis protein CcmH
LLIFAVVAIAPLAWTLHRQREARSRRESALAIHRAQLVELDRDYAEGRIGAAERATAVLEVQRRLLAAADTPEDAAGRANRTPLLWALVVVPLAAAGLYLINGQPFMPAAPRAERMAEEARAAQDADRLIEALRQKLATMDQNSDLARQGYVLLGNAEESRGHLPEAVDAWRRALAIHFDASLAALTAEAQTRLEGKVSAESASLFRRALDAAPPDAPWRALVEQRLAEAK